MISIILYGRNDNYGYNLHKRAALSLNCMAEVLTREDDEILFVDYNTPDDYPTFPEAIADTLTEKARRLIRILRIRPEIHERLYASRTHLKAIEPLSRNVAVRRSNSANTWILSTNTDMIFVPRTGQALSDDVAGLESGFYCAPRMEIPETLWEDFDRKDPAGVIEDVRSLGVQLHLNEIVRGSDDILYDGPGDFQLMRRDDVFRMDGFNEDMILGWHVDSNISKRFKLLHGAVGDAAPIVFGYHCDHTRQVTPMHAHKSPANDMDVFIANVRTPHLPQQRDSWGLAGFEIEEINLQDTPSRRYRATLGRVIAEPLKAPLEAAYRLDTYGHERTPVAHVLPFLVDMFASNRRNVRLAWLGMRDEMLEMFRRCWSELGFQSPIDVIAEPARQLADIAEAEVLIVNFGAPESCSGTDETAVAEAYWTLILSEGRRLSDGRPPRRIIAVNAVHNRFEGLVLSHLSCAKTPFSARLRHGYLIPGTLEFPLDWTGDMCIGRGGVRKGDRIETNGTGGHVMYGPYRALPPGAFEFKVGVTVHSTQRKGRWRLLSPFKKARFVVEIVADEVVRVERTFELDRGSHVLRVPAAMAGADTTKPIQVRLSNTSRCFAEIDSVVVELGKDTPIEWMT